jgi:chaperonin GroEL
MKKRMLFGKEARLKLLEGAEAVYKAVGSSYSPRGRLTSIGRPWGFPIVIADGVNIAREVGSEDLFVDQGIMIIIEAAKKQVEEAGDGTTVTTILAYHLIEKGMKLLDEGVNPMVIRKEIRAALPSVLEELKKLSTPVKGSEDVRRVARISSTDDEIADIVTKAVEKIGKDGQITVEENKVPVMEVSYNEGMQIDKGMATPYFVTDSDKMEAVLADEKDNVAVLVLQKRITTQIEGLLLLEVAMAKSRNILIIGEVEGEALRVAVTNKMKGVINVVTVPPPASGEKRKELLEDIALVTGAKVIDSDDIPMDKEQFAAQFDRAWIGVAKTAVITRNSTLIVRVEEEKDTNGNVANSEANKVIKERNKLINEKIETLRKKRDGAKNIYEKEICEERLAKLTTGVAIIKVGAKAGVDMRERVERVKDAVAAAKACQEEGIVPGGGVSFTQLAKVLEKSNRNKGEELLYQILHEPTKKLLSNSGEDEKSSDSVVKLIKEKGGNFGYDCEDGVVKDVVKGGIIDPTKVIRLALENSIAVATTFLATDTLIVDPPEDNNMAMV